MSTFATQQPRSGVTVISFGEQAIGGPEAVELAGLVREAAASGTSVTIFDLARVTIMNSSGLGMLVSSLTTVKKYNGTLRLANVPEKVRSLLEMTHLSAVFETYASVDEAVGTGA